MYKGLESVEEVLAHIEAHGNLHHTVMQGLDLREQTEALTSVSSTDATFLGCRESAEALDVLWEQEAVIFPRLKNAPYKVYRSQLYSLEELMAGYERGKPETFTTQAHDSVIYRHFHDLHQKGGAFPVLDALAQRIHDHSIDDALHDLLHDPNQERRVVGIMGGHSMKRDQESYRQVARLALALASRGYFVATGGGPGAMEAANLGAWMSAYGPAQLEDALEKLAAVPSYKLPDYIDLAYEVLDRYPTGAESLAIPTWFYGHEPTNQFATSIAKYFSNSIREDGLLAIACHGVIYAPGSAGTIQEIFMDVCQNHYGTFEVVSPMVFFDSSYWMKDKPVYPLLQHLSEGKQYGKMLTMSDDVAEIVAFIEENPPIQYEA